METQIKNENFFNWLEAYKVIKKCFCDRCSKICNKSQKFICIEHFLILVERWEKEFYNKCEKIEKCNN